MIGTLLLAVSLTQMRQCIDAIDPLDDREHVPAWSGHADRQCKVEVQTLAADKVAAWYRWPLAELPQYSVVALVIYEKKNDVVTPLITRVESEDLSRFAKVAVTKGVLEILSCVNGTGGCWQEFSAFRDGAAVPLATNYRDAFNRKLPPGLTTYKAPTVDLKTMTIRGGGWRDGKDPNCCPSITMECKVSFAADQAELSACRTSAP